MASLGEAARRVRGRVTGRLHSLPILALNVHSACNCRCVMCDIWKSNASKREISAADVNMHLAAIRRLRVKRVMLTGGEPLLHSHLWALSDLLRNEGVALTLITTGLLIEAHAEAISERMDQVVISIDGPPAIHDAIRGVSGFSRIEAGVRALRAAPRVPTLIARCVVQRQNHGSLVATIDAVRAIGIDRLSFLAADVTSSAFNRPEPWSLARQNDVALTREEIPALEYAVRRVASERAEALASGFVVGGAQSLWRIHQYYAARLGQGEYPRVRCNAPWVSAVLEPGQQLRPCFFHPPYETAAATDLDAALNDPSAVAFRRLLSVPTNETCRKCVCSLSLPAFGEV